MQVSNRFLALLRFQLAQFADRSDLSSLVVYVTQPGEANAPILVPIGQWPSDGRALPAVEAGSPLSLPAEERRWLPLRHQRVLLGAIQVETSVVPWPDSLGQRLQAVALCLTEALCLDLEQQQLQQTLEQQQAELGLLLHQLRNPSPPCAPSANYCCGASNRTSRTDRWWKACWRKSASSTATWMPSASWAATNKPPSAAKRRRPCYFPRAGGARGPAPARLA